MNDDIALVDIDGTLADYDGQMLSDLERMRSPCESAITDLRAEEKHPHMAERMRLIRTRQGWWRNLPPIKSGLAVAKMMYDMGFCVHILTKGPRSATGAWTEKVEWSDDFVPFAKPMIVQDKSLVYGKVLFDDYPVYAEAWLKERKRGLCIMPDRPWNQGFEHPNLVRYYGLGTESIDHVRTALQIIKERKSNSPLDLSPVRQMEVKFL
jgi:5'(3')-deoxyribonucleotidase